MSTAPPVEIHDAPDTAQGNGSMPPAASGDESVTITLKLSTCQTLLTLAVRGSDQASKELPPGAYRERANVSSVAANAIDEFANQVNAKGTEK